MNGKIKPANDKISNPSRRTLKCHILSPTYTYILHGVEQD